MIFKRYLPKSRQGNFGLAILAVLLAYILASRAIDTGSWWEYLGTLALTILVINRIIQTVRGR